MIVAVFSVALLLSALLLFSIQPMFAKLLLPKLGGAPGVWAVSLAFFQVMLLAGYAYAHVLRRCIGRRWDMIAHLALMAGAVLTLPFGLSPEQVPPAGEPYLWLLGVLAAGIGLPFLAVSATAPLLQAWFAASGHRNAPNPYFLYRASNLGSLLALLSYPVVVEPALGLATQARIWSAGFALLIALIAVSAWISGANLRPPAPAEVEASGIPAPKWSDRARWIGLSFVPSGLLVAFTSYITTDIASVPFLWVMPLAVFLATFILAFREVPAIPSAAMLVAQPLAVIGSLLALLATGGGTPILLFAASTGCAALFVTAMVCHRALYESRPDRLLLTEFYLWMSFGGVLGGMFAAILAPQVFSAILEYPILLLLGLTCRPGLAKALGDPAERQRVGAGAALGLALVGVASPFLSTRLSEDPARIIGLLAMTGLSFMMLRTRERPLRLLANATVAGSVLIVVPSTLNLGDSHRSFFGVHRVVSIEDGAVRVLMHGTTAHGVERLKDKAGTPLTRPVPAAYYHEDGPLARGIGEARKAIGTPLQPLSVGIVGLGAGSMSCHAHPGERWRYYEIDPVVVAIARDRRYFSFLSSCGAGADIVIGDARLTIAREPKGQLDYLVIDAFSSDAIPVHLLTREAIATYLERLSPTGLLALHISNRHLDLRASSAATSLSLPGTYAAVAWHAPPPDTDASASLVMFVTRSTDVYRSILSWPGARPADHEGGKPWTDDFSNIPGALWRHYWGASGPSRSGVVGQP